MPPQAAKIVMNIHAIHMLMSADHGQRREMAVLSRLCEQSVNLGWLETGDSFR